MRTRHVLVGGLALALVAAIASGCAQQIGDIDRTQPNKIEKTAFEGEWYFRQTVVGVNATAITTFVGLEGQMERVVFGVEEDYLVAYRSHEDVIGIDSQYLDPGQTFQHGQPVAAFPIQSHFDIQRQYNSSTGEQTNVISENTSDRNWYDRDYIRVDWNSNSVVTAVDPMVSVARIADIGIAPQDEGAEPTWFVERDADGKVNYIDVLSTFVIEPSWIDCILTFGFPLYGSECGPETVTVRSSFRRIDQDSDFVPREYSDLEMNDFGFFRTERASYDQNYGTRDDNRLYLANIWNLWARSRDDAGNPLPYAQRTPQPIVYYLSASWPEDLKDAAFRVADQYNDAFRRIVAVERGLAVPNDPTAMDQVSYDDVPRMFYLCDNPGASDGPYEVSNQGYQNGICQRAGERKEIGDIRWSFFGWVNQPQQDGPVGYGPSDADPLTGELITGSAYLYGDQFYRTAAYTLDLAKMITGEIDPQDYGYGRTIQDYFDELRQRTGDQYYLGLVQDAAARSEHVHQAVDRRMSDARTRFIDSLDPEDFALRSYGEVNPLERLRGTELERLAVFPEIQRTMRPPDRQAMVLTGDLDVETPLNSDELQQMSVATLGDPIRQLRTFQQRTVQFSAHGANDACVMRNDFSDPKLVGLAVELAQERQDLRAQGMDDFDIDAQQRHEILEGWLIYILAHEAGHTVGLRHNFEASYDSLNYGLDYWHQRQQTFDTCDPSFVTFTNDGFYSGTVAPPSCDGNETVSEYDQRNAALYQQLLEGRIHDYQYSSVMDYLPHTSTGWNGLGRYDYAALAYGYGDLVEIFNEAPHKLHVDIQYDPETDDYLGSDISVSDLRVRTFDDVDDYVIRRRNVVMGDDPTYQRVGEAGQEHSYRFYHYSMLPAMFGGNVEAMYDRSLVPRDQVGERVAVPYRFCSDEYYGSSIECQVWDNGADYLEIFQDTNDYWNEYYIMRFFRRDRAGFGLWLYPTFSSIYGYAMAPMTRLYQYWLLRFSGNGVAWANESWGGEDATLAAFAAVDFLGNIITTPEVGTYYFDENQNMYLNLDDHEDYRAPAYFEAEQNIDPSTDYLNVGLDVGRYGFEQYRRDHNDRAGYYYFLETEVLSWFWAKWAAMMALVLPEVDVLGVDTQSDVTAYSIPIYLYFEDEMTSFFGAIPREDFNVLGSCVRMNGSGRTADEVLQRNLATGAPADCTNAQILNPYTDVYGNADFNMRLMSILYSSANFQSNYSQNWMDLSNVYILGRGFNLDPAPGYTLAVYEHRNGVQYGALVPEEIPADDDPNRYVGYQFITRMQDLRDESDAIYAAEGESSNYWDKYYELENMLEDVRLLNQANQLFEGYNVFLPWVF